MDVKVVIMAGGKGTRLRPYTYVIPKPLMPIGSYPIIETIIFQLKKAGLKDVYIMCAYKADVLKVMVDEICLKYGMKATYVHDKRDGLGTVGPVAQLQGMIKDDFITINGDTLATLDYQALYTYHVSNKNALTVALYRRDVKIDFGVVKSEKGLITDYIEKPTESFLVSLGANVYSPRILKYIRPEGEDFPDLVRELIKRKERVGAYLFEGYWRDIGRQEDFDLANAECATIFAQMGIPVVEEK